MKIILQAHFFNKPSKVLSSLILGLLFCSSLLAQRTVTGTVSSEEGETLIGASVQVKGTSTGAVTDLDGKYTISVAEDAKILLFTYTGFSDQEVAIGASNVVDVTLSEGVDLSEVVVIGYAPIAREKVLGAVSSVKSEEIVENTPVSAFDAVQGRLAQH